jgi:hypothetical protein
MSGTGCRNGRGATSQQDKIDSRHRLAVRVDGKARGKERRPWPPNFRLLLGSLQRAHAVLRAIGTLPDHEAAASDRRRISVRDQKHM